MLVFLEHQHWRAFPGRKPPKGSPDLDFASHGWGGRGAQFREFKPALTAAGFQLVVFDHVSHGHSEGVEAPITDFAKGVAAVAKHLELRRISIAGFVGHSLGCAGIGSALRGDLKHLKNIRVVQIAPPRVTGSLFAVFHENIGVIRAYPRADAIAAGTKNRCALVGV